MTPFPDAFVFAVVVSHQHAYANRFSLFFDIEDNENVRALLEVYGNFSGESGRSVKFAETFGESDMLSRCPFYATEKQDTVL